MKNLSTWKKYQLERLPRKYKWQKNEEKAKTTNTKFK